MNYFWYTYKQLPGGVGFSYFDEKHLIMLGLILVAITASVLFFYRLSSPSQEVLLKAIAVSTLAGNILRDIFLLSNDAMSLEYLPLHLCSLSIFVYLLHAFLKPSRIRDALGEISFCLLMPGSISALLFPNWTAYPILNFMSLHSFVWHALLVLYPILLFESHRIHPKVSHWYFPVLFLVVIVPPIYLFNWIAGTNYLFINTPAPGTPLELLYSLMGKWWRVGYGALVLLVILMMLGLAESIDKFQNPQKTKK